MMIPKDPIEEAEKLIRQVNDKAGNYTQPVLSKYPLLFAMLFTFSVAAVMEGFKAFIKYFEIFEQHPSLLMVVGMLGLILTGSLYKWLKKAE